MEIKANNTDDLILIDVEDAQKLCKYKWTVYQHRQTKYAVTRANGRNTKLHKMLFPEYKTVDHINGNGLDNRKINLREATVAQQAYNRRVHGKYSKYKGVCWHKRCKRWTAGIKIGGKRINLGYYCNEIDAAIAYNYAAKEIFGEYACLNVIIKEE